MEDPPATGTAFTADLRPSRLNLLVIEGQVVRAAFFSPGPAWTTGPGRRPRGHVLAFAASVAGYRGG